MNFDHKILSLSSLEKNGLDTNKKIVVAGGCFDILHFGHLTFLQKAKSAGDILVLLLEPNEFILTVKKKTPVHTQRQRAEILAAIGYVDYVILLPLLKDPNKDYPVIIKGLHPSVIALTEGDPISARKKEFAQSIGAETLSIPYLSSFSSSQLITYAPIFRD